jgi:hypothetical protein
MLPHRDRSALRKIEEELAASDPAFVAALSQGAPPAGTRLWQTTLILADLTAVLMIAFGLIAADTGLFLWGLVAVPLLVWIHRTLLLRKRNGSANDA